MIIVGLVLVAIGAGFGAAVLSGDRFSTPELTAFGQNLSMHGATRLFALGLGSGAIVILGMCVVVAGFVRYWSSGPQVASGPDPAVMQELAALRQQVGSLHHQLSVVHDSVATAVSRPAAPAALAPSATDPTGATPTRAAGTDPTRVAGGDPTRVAGQPGPPGEATGELGPWPDPNDPTMVRDPDPTWPGSQRS